MSFKKVGIVAAMPEEFSLLTGRFGAKSVGSIGPREFFAATVGGRELVFTCSRIGKVAAASTATTLVQSFGVEAMLLTGVAGAIGSQARVGDVVIADSLVQHDIDLKGVLGYQRFQIPLLDLSAIPADPNLTRIAREAAASVVQDGDFVRAVGQLALREPSFHCGTIASGDRFINSAQEREELLGLIPGVLAVEMEGAAVAQVCAEQRVPFAVARVISDSADHGANFDFLAFLRQAAAVGSERMVSEFVGRL